MVPYKTLVGCVVETADHARGVMDLQTVVWSGMSVASVEEMVLRVMS